MATLKQIASEARVSVGTVDRVIHNRGRVSLDTAQRIRQIIRDMDYKPNILARSLSLSKTYLFGILIPFPEQDGHYWELPINGIEKAWKELRVYKVSIKYFYYDKYSEASFAEASSRMLQETADLDGLIVAPVLSKAAEKFLKKIPKDLPYLFFDSYIPNSRCLSYIGEDSFQSGVLAGKLMHILVPPTGSIAIITVHPMDYHIEDRVRGFYAFFQDIGSYKLVTFTANIREQTPFYSMTKKIMAEKKDLIGIFAPNACAYQVAECLGECTDHKVFVIGYDLIQENLAHLERGAIDFLISQQSERQGYDSIYRLYRHVVLSEGIEKKLYMPLDIVTRENLQYCFG